MTTVVKIGGRAQSGAHLPQTIAAAHAHGRPLCIVHGGGDEVSALQRSLGSEPTFLNGRRVTTPEDMSVVRMVLSGTINKRLVAQLAVVGVPAIGLSGEDAELLGCVLFEDGAFGVVGEPTRVNTRALTTLMDAGFVPVISPVGFLVGDHAGCNVNGDDAAAAIARALRAEELLLVADVAGVLDNSGTPIAHIDAHETDTFIANGIARGGMIAKLQAATRALDGDGVRQVRIGGLEMLTAPHAGTRIARGVPIAQ